MNVDYYAILGVPDDATQRQIEAAYFEQMRRLQQSAVPHQAVQKLQEAFTVLSSHRQRSAYDRSVFRQKRAVDPSAGKPPAEPLIPSRQPTDLGRVSLTRSFRSFRPSFEEIYDRFWANFSPALQPKSESLRSLSIEIPITPEQAVTGGQARVLVPTQERCPSCDGRGAVGQYVCWRCDGRGEHICEYPVIVSFPAGASAHTVRVALERFGIHNFYLTVHFRMTHDEMD